MTKPYIIPRDVLARVFTNPRAMVAYERLQGTVSTVEDGTVANVEATNALRDASFLTLSPNAELPNEYVLGVGSGLALTPSDGAVHLSLTNNVARATGGFNITFVSSGDAVVGLPLSGVLVTAGNSQFLGVRNIAASGAVAGDDYLLLVDATAGAVTVTLPAVALSNRRVLVVKKVDASANAVTVDGDAAETIDGAASQSLTGQWDALTLACNGAGWFIL